MNIKQGSTFFCICLLISIPLLLVYKYSRFTDLYNYYGYNNNFSGIRIILSTGTLFASSMLCLKNKTFSSFACKLAVIFVFIPSLILYCSSTTSDLVFIVVCFGIFSLLLFCKILSKLTFLKLSFFKIEPNVLMNTLCIYIFLCLFVLIYFTGTGFFNIDLALVYDYRSDILKKTPVFLQYLLSWSSKVCLPILILLSIKLKKYSYLFIGALGAFLFFTFTAHKSPIAIALVSILLYYGILFVNKGFKSVLCIYFVFLVILGLCFHNFYEQFLYDDETKMFGTLIFRRCFFDTALCDSFYIDTFGMETPFMYFTDKKLSYIFFQSPVSFDVCSYIGKKYFTTSDASPNTGWLGSGYAQIGIFGVVLYSLLISLFCKFVESNINNKSRDANIVVFSIQLLLMLCSSDFFTCLLNHGALLYLFINGAVTYTSSLSNADE